MSGTRTTVREYEGDMLVESATVVAEDVVALTLVDPDGDALPPWTPGAHVDLILSDGLVRQYSLCSSPGDSRTIRLGILRAPDSRGGSTYVHDNVREGSVVRVRGPRNHFPLVAAPRYIFIGGGIGITPMLPMVAEAEASGADWHLYYGGRTRASMGFVDELATYGDKVTLVPQDEAGMLDLATVLGDPRDDTLVYVCGPEGLLAAVEARCAADWPAEALHLERFAAKEVEAPAGGERAFELELAASGVTLSVPPDKSIFDVIQDAGISVLGSCHEGICGTCEQIVLEGEVDHRDSVLSESERAANDAMMVCVSRCFSDRLVLDL
jgi:ferredoxin-NADP reductase